MRVSEATKQTTSMNNMVRNSSEAERISQTISTGRRVLNPSDDPVSSVKGEGKLRNLTLNNAVQNNIYAQRSELDVIDFTLEETGVLIRDAKVLTLEAANGHMNEVSLNATAFQMDKLMDRLLDLSNTKIGKVYLFAGTKSLTAPVALNKSGKVADVFHPGDVWRSNHALNSVKNDDQASIFNNDGNFQVFFTDGGKKEHQLNITLHNIGNTSDLINRLNESFAEYQKNNFPVDDLRPERLLTAQIGSDNSLYVDSAAGFKIRAVETDIFKNFGTDFEKTTAKEWTKYSGSNRDHAAYFMSLFGEKLTGQPTEEFTVKIVTPGNGDRAEYVILNANREAITPPTELNGTIHAPVNNNDGDPEWQLSFEENGEKHYFKTGLEFRFYPDSFAVYQGNDDIRDIPLDDGKKLPITVTANDMFFKLDGKSDSTFNLLKNVRDAMKSNQQELIASYIDDFDPALNKVLGARANIGSTTIEIDTAENRIKQADLIGKEKYSELIEQNFPEAATDLKKNQLKTDATYQVTSSLIQPGLINFLK